MPRSSRIDAPGALHHIMARGIEKRGLFRSRADREDFLQRLGGILLETRTACFAWALLLDHVHLVLKTGDAPVSNVMRRTLTGYAVSYNHRHRRSGILFQNRFKSVLCQEERYLFQLVRYVHLHPLRSGRVADLPALDRCPDSGHSVLMGNSRNDWQDTGRILGFFRKNGDSGRRRYREFVERGVGDGEQPDLTGGGLVRSAGGWARVKALRRQDAVLPSDERILGDGAFVERVLALANEARMRRCELASEGMTVDRIAARVAALCGMEEEEVWTQGRQRRLVEARSMLCYWAVRELGTDMTSLARRLRLSVPAVSRSVVRGGKLVKERGISLRKKRPFSLAPRPEGPVRW